MNPWESLDLDDSDLPSLLRPCKRLHHQTTTISPSPSPSPQSQIPTPTSSSNQPITQLHSTHPISLLNPNRPLIPGPAGQLQAAMLQKTHDRQNNNPDDDVISTQEYIRKAVEDKSSEFDYHFQSIPWISALQFLGVVDGVIPSTPLSSIKDCLDVGKFDRVVAVIESCTPNGFGGLMVTLKDPTGKVDASVHHRVLSESEFGKDLLIGSVVILEKVAVFAPSRKACYLNITLRNLIKVFGKDKNSPAEQVYAASKSVAPENDSSGEASRLDGMSSELETIKDIQEETRRCTIMSQVQNDSQIEKENVHPRNPSWQKEVRVNQSASKSKYGSPWQDSTNAAFEIPAREKDVSEATNSKNTDAETQRDGSVQNQTQPLLARTSLPQYTDEQLLLLFANDDEDDSFGY